MAVVGTRHRPERQVGHQSEGCFLSGLWTADAEISPSDFVSTGIMGRLDVQSLRMQDG